jgi:hypothetical protein
MDAGTQALHLVEAAHVAHRGGADQAAVQVFLADLRCVGSGCAKQTERPCRHMQAGHPDMAAHRRT